MLSEGKKWLVREGQMDLAHQAVMLEDAQALLADNRNKIASRQTLKDDGSSSPAASAGDPGMIVVGDYTENHVAPVPAPAQAASGLVKGALMGALGISTLGGAGLAGYALNKAAPIVQTITQPGTNSDAHVELLDPIPPRSQ